MLETDHFTGNQMYPELKKLYQRTIFIAQSQAEVERRFSESKNLLTIRQASMGLDTFKNKKYTMPDSLKAAARGARQATKIERKTKLISSVKETQSEEKKP
jgi:hypothetical protein